MNAILKRFFNWKESPVDTIVIAFSELSASFYAEIMRGRYGRGNYNLHDDFTSCYDLEKDCPVLPETRTEEEIFLNLQNSIKQASQTVNFTPSFFLSSHVQTTDSI